MTKLAKKINTSEKTDHSVEIKRHLKDLSTERTDELLDGVVEMLINYLKCECNTNGNRDENLRDGLAKKERNKDGDN